MYQYGAHFKKFNSVDFNHYVHEKSINKKEITKELQKEIKVEKKKIIKNVKEINKLEEEMNKKR